VYSGIGTLQKTIPVPSEYGIPTAFSDSLLLCKNVESEGLNPVMFVESGIDMHGNLIFRFSHDFVGALFFDPSSSAIKVVTLSGKLGTLTKQ
jgi:hypothetical protein